MGSVDRVRKGCVCEFSCATSKQVCFFIEDACRKSERVNSLTLYVNSVIWKYEAVCCSLLGREAALTKLNNCLRCVM